MRNLAKLAASEKPTLNLFTGAPGSSKTTVARLICEFVAVGPESDEYPIGWCDTSTFLANSREWKTPTGLKLLDVMPQQTSGMILDASLVVPSIIENFERLKGKYYSFILAGSPRTVEESKYFLGCGHVCHLFEVKCLNDQQSIQGVNLRASRGEKRIDAKEEDVRNRLAEYNKKAVPAIKAFRGQSNFMVTTIKREWPLLRRLQVSIANMTVPTEIKSIWLQRLRDEDHPVFAEIDKIENGTCSNQPAYPVPTAAEPDPVIHAYA